ncbi:hypothetical protein F4821DRAFT_258425 [Hypoxylon rubiginosum]|uniref:Uncharacterized protein n=1 Tax=Hypoxylon rubiginosum TaxID=110542 RepID=A0ACC0D6H8_9PEZI|nr:hypothetical protein F4821DRAFT_258425 [Hypoxylon rubiginosum]
MSNDNDQIDLVGSQRHAWGRLLRLVSNRVWKLDGFGGLNEIGGAVKVRGSFTAVELPELQDVKGAFERGVFQLDLNMFPALDVPGLPSGGMFDMGNLSTDAPMPSSVISEGSCPNHPIPGSEEGNTTKTSKTSVETAVFSPAPAPTPAPIPAPAPSLTPLSFDTPPKESGENALSTTEKAGLLECPISTEGIFSCSIMAIARCLTEPEFELEHALTLFARDEVIFWFTSSRRTIQLNDNQLRETVQTNCDIVKLLAHQTIIIAPIPADGL